MPISVDKRIRIFARDDFRCRSCQAQGSEERVRHLVKLARGGVQQLGPQDLTLDHIIPRSAGGTDHEDNLQTLCSECNQRKAATLPENFTPEEKKKAAKVQSRRQPKLREQLKTPETKPFATVAQRMHSKDCHPIHGCSQHCPVEQLLWAAHIDEGYAA